MAVKIKVTGALKLNNSPAEACNRITGCCKRDVPAKEGSY